MVSYKYKLSFKRSAEKELRKIPPPDISRLVQKIGALSDEPRPLGAQMLKGDNRYFRLRQGDYRIVYEINDGTREITVIKIGHRREVYQ
ncbi:MAG TPA: type II toxin-antitoxin system RelE/ParE family toxin [Candidatus Omnitrophota bacterium]|nr:type II toxin-antitoxin system RelE/ParE family toxin [Candidatus Omnitrophota bacterium]